MDYRDKNNLGKPDIYSLPEREKIAMISSALDMAKRLTDRKQKVFTLSGLIVFTDKVMTEEDKKEVRRHIMMTGIGRMFEEEKIEAVKKAKVKTRRKVRKATRKMDTEYVLSKGKELGLPESALHELCAGIRNGCK